MNDRALVARLQRGDALDRSWAAAIASKSIAAAVENPTFTICAECTPLASAREDRELLGVLRVATSEDLEASCWNCCSCGALMKCEAAS